jgi:hypothetical protein
VLPGDIWGRIEQWPEAHQTVCADSAERSLRKFLLDISRGSKFRYQVLVFVFGLGRFLLIPPTPEFERLLRGFLAIFDLGKFS